MIALIILVGIISDTEAGSKYQVMGYFIPVICTPRNQARVLPIDETK